MVHIRLLTSMLSIQRLKPAKLETPIRTPTVPYFMKTFSENTMHLLENISMVIGETRKIFDEGYTTRFDSSDELNPRGMSEHQNESRWGTT
ncbi:hypothetical protein SCHPADRAFT_995131 [Schizopora paradoxa]|uniref:Uncharacterized protein n=1 Tax=Schizopora paradoxa TaxID=27342 RepID=A0A0H2RWR9_9AGAM|nr:hypothetical protein SCHPADRAFT_995131 [Schizopora paradoxa]